MSVATLSEKAIKAEKVRVKEALTAFTEFNVWTVQFRKTYYTVNVKYKTGLPQGYNYANLTSEQQTRLEGVMEGLALHYPVKIIGRGKEDLQSLPPSAVCALPVGYVLVKDTPVIGALRELVRTDPEAFFRLREEANAKPIAVRTLIRRPKKVVEPKKGEESEFYCDRPHHECSVLLHDGDGGYYCEDCDMECEKCGYCHHYTEKKCPEGDERKDYVMWREDESDDGGCSSCPTCANTYTQKQIDGGEVVPCNRCYKCFVGECGKDNCACEFAE